MKQSEGLMAEWSWTELKNIILGALENRFGGRQKEWEWDETIGYLKKERKGYLGQG